jgi:biopolymer transport protein ExbD
MASIETSAANRNKFGVKKMAKKSTKVDLTPMVDLGFLLITFFVFTTTMSMTTAMDLNETKQGVSMQVPSSGATTILLGKNNEVYYYFGEFETAKQQHKIIKTSYADLRNIIATKKKNTPPEKLMFIIKATDESTMGNAVTVLDEMNICGVKPGHYAEDKISEEEKAIFLEK